MTVQDSAAAVAMVFSLSLAAVQGVDDFVARTFPPPIEGAGQVEGPVVAGDVAMVSWTITKRTECPGENWRVWSGEAGFSMSEPAGPTTLPTSIEPRTYRIPTQIPDQAPPGDLQLRIVGHYQCIGSPRVNWELGPVEFTVIEEDQQ